MDKNLTKLHAGVDSSVGNSRRWMMMGCVMKKYVIRVCELSNFNLKFYQIRSNA